VAKRKWKLAIAAITGVLLLAFLAYAYQLWRIGNEIGLFDPDQVREYQGSNVTNLKALRTALMLYHDNEDHFPASSGWMDAIEQNLKANDMKQEEAEKKLVNPLIAPKPGVFGYGMNDAASLKYKKDIKDPKTVLVYDSSDTRRNAHGDPLKSKGAGAKGITLDGTIVDLK
jgi:hypothetical protein